MDKEKKNKMKDDGDVTKSNMLVVIIKNIDIQKRLVLV
jgi:hypothetical protein